MKKVIVLAITALIFAGLTAVKPAEAGSPVWTFTVKVGLSQDIVDRNGDEATTQEMVYQQLSEVSSRFAGFTGTIEFVPTVFYTYSTTPVDEMFKPHPESDFLIIYNEAIGVNGGWQGSNQAILQSWTLDWGGVFSAYGTDGLTHEFGHARGAVDLYGLEVSTNTVNGATYSAPQSIMTYPYGETLWDKYSRNIINASGSEIYSGAPVVSKSMPTAYTVVVKNKATGRTITGATVKVYPVEWFSGAVSTTPLMSGKTGKFGKWKLPRNPFMPGAVGKPWDLAYPNFLVVASYQGRTTSRWLSLVDVGNAYFTGVSNFQLVLNL